MPLPRIKNKRKFFSDVSSTSTKKIRRTSFDDKSDDDDLTATINDNKENVVAVSTPTQRNVESTPQSFNLSPTTTHPADPVSQFERNSSFTFEQKSGLNKIRINVSVCGRNLLVPMRLEDKVGLEFHRTPFYILKQFHLKIMFSKTR